MKEIMKKLIQICSLLSVVLVFTAVSASAQSVYGSEVEIPFSFSINSRTYEAGKYVVKLNKLQSGAATVIIVDPKNDSVQTVLAQRNGSNADNSVKLVFEAVNGQRVLNEVLTPGGGFAVMGNRKQREVASVPAAPKAAAASAGSHF